MDVPLRLGQQFLGGAVILFVYMSLFKANETSNWTAKEKRQIEITWLFILPKSS